MSFISDIENKRRKPSMDTLKLLANAFSIPASELLGEENTFNNNLDSFPTDDAFNNLDDDIKDIILKINKLSKENKQKALKMLDIFSEEK
ncbi:helix-turn-helix domain-containing protein [Clostridium saccharobutylicum]|uniref:helix-turn-helix domain-containing protein n=1 Tax=Clostridium saccharobutylicum TaxID=169679 RepID=UPI00214FBC5C|nr:helix-turn-helix transcriptional regulator [Clostridium saccharobutylicum]